MYEAVKVENALSPHIVLGSEEHRRLMKLAAGYAGHVTEDADSLLHELERAEVLPDASLPNDVVKMDSFVRFVSSSGGERTIQLVFPEQADISARRVSVLTPIGTALIGLRPGQSISWLTRDGRQEVLTILEVNGNAR